MAVRIDHRRFLKVLWAGQLYQFVGMPNGLACAPRIFTKLLTPVFASLREEGVECFPYIDNSLVLADSQEECQRRLVSLGLKLDSLGFVIHKDKSVLTPQQELTFLGFELNSLEMVVKLGKKKREKFMRAQG